MKYFCPDCGKEISRGARRCFHCAHIGKRHSEETKAKQSRAHIREKNPHWNGGRCFIRGYKLVLCPDHPKADFNGYVPEHRLVLEKKIGRHLLPGEVVHHIDMNPANNSPENLVAMTNGDHRRYHVRLNHYMAGM